MTAVLHRHAWVSNTYDGAIEFCFRKLGKNKFNIINQIKFTRIIKLKTNYYFLLCCKCKCAMRIFVAGELWCCRLIIYLSEG